MRTRILLTFGLGLTAVAATLSPSAASATEDSATAAGHRRAPADDFNGDGHPDVAIGYPYTAVGDAFDAGALAVVYGSRHGLSADRSTLLTQGSPGVGGEAGRLELFGNQITTADLDRDGYTDLIVSAVGEAGSAPEDPDGAVHVLWGGPQGAGSETTILPAPDDDRLDRFGLDTVVADFDGDGHQQLAVLGTDAFAVYEDGLTPESVPPVTVTEVQLPDGFESARELAAGDLDGDGDDDLVAASEVWSSYTLYRLRYFPGGPGGIDGTQSQLISGSASRSALAIDDFDRDGRDDLVTNALFSDESPRTDHIIIRYGAPGGPGADRTQEIGPGSPGVPGDPDSEGSFGSRFSTGDADGDGYTDLAVAAAGRDLGPGIEEAGQVTILRGSAAGLTGAGARSVSQDTAGVPDTAEYGDLFGFQVRLTPLDGDRRADLLVTAVGERLDDGSGYDAGTVWALRQGPPLGRVRSGTLLTADGLGVTGWLRWAVLPD